MLFAKVWRWLARQAREAWLDSGCLVGLHQWTPWTDPQRVIESIGVVKPNHTVYKWIQTRQCQQCRIGESRHAGQRGVPPTEAEAATPTWKGR